MALAAPAAQAEPFLPGYFTDNASAGSASVTAGPLTFELARFANIGCPCGGTNGKRVVNRVGPIGIPGVVGVSATVATGEANRTATTASTTMVSTILAPSLLGGIVHASAIQAEASLKVTASDFSGSALGSHFVRLVVAGHAINARPPENTVIPLAGFGTITLNRVTHIGTAKTRMVTVDMLVIDITTNNSLLPVGSEIILGHATAGYNRMQPDKVVGGQAYAATSNIQALNLLPDFVKFGGAGISDCAGTSGVTVKNSVASLNEGGFSLGAATSTAYGGPTGPNTSIAQTTTTLGGLSLLGGLIGAGAMTSEATETVSGHTLTASTAGTSFASLVIAGVSLPLSPPPNTMIPLPLLGYVIVNEQSAPAAGRFGPLSVNGLHLYVTTPNLLNLPVGLEVILAHADAIARPLAE